MLKCNMGRCPNEVVGGFKHEVLANHSGSKNLTVESGASFTLWCKEHEDDFSGNLSGPGRYLTDKELHVLKKIS
jgi:hypothetical protein